MRPERARVLSKIKLLRNSFRRFYNLTCHRTENQRRLSVGRIDIQSRQGPVVRRFDRTAYVGQIDTVLRQ
jgi:hypothetical protein